MIISSGSSPTPASIFSPKKTPKRKGLRPNAIISTPSEKQDCIMFKDLMVQLDGTEEDEVRLAHAKSIAARFQAHLTGLCSNPIPEYGLAFAGEPSYVAADTVI